MLSIDIDKYELLYKYHKDNYEEARARYQRLEDKVFRYLTALTFAFSSYLLLVRSVYNQFERPYTWFTVVIFIAIALTFYSCCSAWSFIFRAIKLQSLVKLPYGGEMINVFNKSKRASIYLGLSTKYSEATKLIEKEYEEKLRFVRKAYEEVAFSGYCFLISVTLIFFYLWRC